MARHVFFEKLKRIQSQVDSLVEIFSHNAEEFSPDDEFEAEYVYDSVEQGVNKLSAIGRRYEQRSAKSNNPVKTSNCNDAINRDLSEISSKSTDGKAVSSNDCVRAKSHENIDEKTSRGEELPEAARADLSVKECNNTDEKVFSNSQTAFDDDDEFDDAVLQVF